MDAGDDLDLANFFNEVAPMRISTLSSERMIVERQGYIYIRLNDKKPSGLQMAYVI